MTQGKPGAGGRPFTELIASGEIVVLRHLAARLSTAPVDDRTTFLDMVVVAFTRCGLDPKRLAGDLGIGLSSVRRWIDGRSAPYRAMWPAVQAWVVTGLEARILEVAAELECRDD